MTRSTLEAGFGPDPFGGKGFLVIDRPDKRVWACVEEVAPGKQRWDYCTQTLVDPLLEANKIAYDESDGKTWGDGKVVASIPLDMYFRELVPAKKNGDTAFIKRWLNDPDHRAFRTFKGQI